MEWRVLCVGIIIGYLLALVCFYVYLKNEHKINRIFIIPNLLKDSIINYVKGGEK